MAITLRSMVTAACLCTLSTCAFGAPPDNDDCIDAGVAVGGDNPFTTIDATTDGNPDPVCLTNLVNQIDNDVWFKYSAECTGNLTASICGAPFDSKMAVYDGCNVCPPTDSPIGCDDDFCAVNGASQLTVPVVARNCYLIRIGSFSPSSGTGAGTLSLSCDVPPPPSGACCATATCLGTMTESACTSSGGTLWVEDEGCPSFACPIPPPPNDECATCSPVFTDTPVNGTTVGASGTDITSCSGEDTLDVWHCWTADCTGTVTISLCDPDPTLMRDPTLAVFDACGGTELACDDDGCPGSSLRSELSLPVTTGTQYRIRVSGFNESFGDYTLNVSTCVGGSETGACCFDQVFENQCAQATLEQCNVAAGTWFGPGSECLGSGGGNDPVCDPFTWLDHNGEDPDGYLPDFDQNNDFDNADADGDPTTGVDPFYNGPAAVADSLWWLHNAIPGRGIIAPAAIPPDLIQDLALRMATDGQTASPNGHIAPYGGTFLDDMRSGVRDYIAANGLTGVIVEQTLAEPSYAIVAGEALLNRAVTVQLGFYRVTGVVKPAAETFLINWRRTGGQYVTVAGTNVDDIQIGISDPDADAAEEGGEGQVRGADHDHDGDLDPGTAVPYRDAAYDHDGHNIGKAFASHDAYDTAPA
ncbi:MAG: hypothetical protein IID33_08635, partial [Planctomycetes bacterium]|nr:hypothetical protein [Planctomycetota bacterium]